MDDQDRLEAIIQHEERHSKNLNEVFEEYGTETLEAKVPIVEGPTFQKMQGIDSQQQAYATLALKSESATAAVRGMRPKTRNADLQVVTMNGTTMLSVGQIRERSPVDRVVLDDELDTYMLQAAKLKAEKMNVDEEPSGSVNQTTYFPLPPDLEPIDVPLIEHRKIKFGDERKPTQSFLNRRIYDHTHQEELRRLNAELEQLNQQIIARRRQKEAMERLIPQDIENEYDENL